MTLSVPWPLIQDAPVMHYIAWRIGEGDVPYRDLYDINQPGVYVLHLALLRTLGAGDVAWRAFDLGWLAVTAGAAALLAARWGALAATGAGLGFAAYHLAGGAWQTGQRDFLLCVFLLAGALGVARWLERRGGVWSLAGAGLALGAAVGLKPYAALFTGALRLVVLVAAVRRRQAGDALRSLARDIADGGLHALLRLGVRQPTRFLYDVFFHESDWPVVRALRAEFLAALEARSPRFVVLMRGWPSADYDRIERFPALADLLARGYEVLVTREGHRLYGKRAGG